MAYLKCDYVFLVDSELAFVEYLPRTYCIILEADLKRNPERLKGERCVRLTMSFRSF